MAMKAIQTVAMRGGRQASSAPRPPAAPKAHAGEARVAVIGAGLSGTLVAIHLLWRCRPGERVYLVERSGRLAAGVAYATGNPGHLVNVRAERMSAFADDPAHFVRWLSGLPDVERQGIASTEVGAFVPRGLYGSYLSSLLRDAIARQGGKQHLFIVNDEVTGVRASADALEIESGCGRAYPIDTVVLALGQLAPTTTPLPGYVADPWAPAALADLDPERRVLLLGTGLTMADLCVSLGASSFAGPITALSRRGLLPQPHRAVQAAADFRLDAEDRRSLTRLTTGVRREIHRAAAAGSDWRAVIDALRPYVQLLWQELRPDDRARFIRHLRPWWDTYRHRMAPPVAAALAGLQGSGRLAVARGRLLDLAPHGDGLRVRYRPRGTDAVLTLDVQRVIDCTGPRTDVAEAADPLVRGLHASGLVAADPLRLGFATTEAGAILDAQGRISDRLFAVGPIARGAFWEMTAVPEISQQAERVAITALAAARRAVGAKRA